jgi:hypothetical protein
MFGWLSIAASALKVAITPFLQAVGSGLGGHVAESVWSIVTGAGHPNVAAELRTGSASLEAQKTSQQVLAAAVTTQPAQANELAHQVATNPIAHPIATQFQAVFSAQPSLAQSFAAGTSALTQIEDTWAELFNWTPEQARYHSQHVCPVGAEPLPLFGSVITYIDSVGRSGSPYDTSQHGFVQAPDGRWWTYSLTAHCPTGHQWQVYKGEVGHPL